VSFFKDCPFFWVRALLWQALRDDVVVSSSPERERHGSYQPRLDGKALATLLSQPSVAKFLPDLEEKICGDIFLLLFIVMGKKIAGSGYNNTFADCLVW
jgi:hypothetical protein